MTLSTELLNQELDKIDIVRDRTGLCFEDACGLLEDANWDVMQALVMYEQELRDQGFSSVVVSKLKELIHQGNTTNVRIKNNQRTVVEVPVTLGVLGTILAPRLMLLAGVTCLLTKCSVEFSPVELD
ncbi:MAG: DUF4342 domain-containing protein [Firmicutes bacterium]|nr:DUF4342 domain-containing protein [Bacillota bacterium]